MGSHTMHSRDSLQAIYGTRRRQVGSQRRIGYKDVESSHQSTRVSISSNISTTVVSKLAQGSSRLIKDPNKSTRPGELPEIQKTPSKLSPNKSVSESKTVDSYSRKHDGTEHKYLDLSPPSRTQNSSHTAKGGVLNAKYGSTRVVGSPPSRTRHSSHTIDEHGPPARARHSSHTIDEHGPPARARHSSHTIYEHSPLARARHSSHTTNDSVLNARYSGNAGTRHSSQTSYGRSNQQASGISKFIPKQWGLSKTTKRPPDNSPQDRSPDTSRNNPVNSPNTRHVGVSNSPRQIKVPTNNSTPRNKPVIIKTEVLKVETNDRSDNKSNLISMESNDSLIGHQAFHTSNSGNPVNSPKTNQSVGSKAGSNKQDLNKDSLSNDGSGNIPIGLSEYPNNMDVLLGHQAFHTSNNTTANKLSQGTSKGSHQDSHASNSGPRNDGNGYKSDEVGHPGIPDNTHLLLGHQASHTSFI